MKTILSCFSNIQAENDIDSQDIQNLCTEAEIHAEALVAPLRRTVEELDKLYDNIKIDSKQGAKVEEICNEIDDLICKLKEMVSATSLEIQQATGTAEMDDKVDNDDHETQEEEQ